MASTVDPAGSFSLVLGAGGLPGLAYHAGTLLAMQLHGFDPADAVSVTGTSAGSIVTAMLATGGTVEDLAAHTTQATPRVAYAAAALAMDSAQRRHGRVSLRELGSLGDARRVVAAARHLRRGRMVAALASMAPGLVEISDRFAFFDAFERGAVRWRIVAADVTGARHVFGDGDSPLSIAVAASCAVPGVFAPVRHGGRRFVDGGVHSTTNADLTVDDGSAVVVVLAPMCCRHGATGELPQRTLDAEVASLRAAGRTVVVFSPTAGLRRRMGRNPLAGGRCREITREAFLEAADVLGQLGPRRRVPSPRSVLAAS